MQIVLTNASLNVNPQRGPQSTHENLANCSQPTKRSLMLRFCKNVF